MFSRILPVHFAFLYQLPFVGTGGGGGYFLGGGGFGGGGLTTTGGTSLTSSGFRTSGTTSSTTTLGSACAISSTFEVNATIKPITPPMKTRHKMPQINFLAYISLKLFTYSSILASGVISSGIFSLSTIYNGFILFDVFLTYLIPLAGLVGLPISFDKSSPTEDSSSTLSPTRCWLLACWVIMLSYFRLDLMWLSMSEDGIII
jgi:hypothetical protein